MSSSSKQNRVAADVAEVVDDAFLPAVSLCFSRIFPAVLNAAVDINLFEIIAKAQSSSSSSRGLTISLSASEIASLLPNQHSNLANRLERMLNMLTSYSLLTCSIRTNEDDGRYFVCDNNEGSLSQFSTLVHRGYQDIWNDVNDAIVDPNNNNHFQKVYGMPAYQYMGTNKELNDIFSKGMSQLGSLEMKMILKLYKGFEGVSTLVDVGGGLGEVLKQIISKYPSIKGINFDLPQVIQDASPHLGIKHVEGDMFESVPKGDAILLKHVCHNWPDEQCIKILRICHEALPEQGKVILVDFIIPEAPDSSIISKHACFADNFMFLVTGGKERTHKEFENLCRNSGFSKFHVACSDFSVASRVMEFCK